MRNLGKVAASTALVALLVPAYGAASAVPIAEPFSLDAGLRHGPERIEDAVPPRGIVGVPYSHQFESGQAGATFSASASDLPPGLSLGGDGLLSGTPTTPGHSFFVVFALDSEGEGTEQQVNMDVVAPPQLALEPANPYQPTRAVLHGRLTPGNLTTYVWFEYWPTAAPAVVRTPVDTIGVGVQPVELIAKLDGLTPGTEYGYRLAATSELSPDVVRTGPITFATELPAPEAGKSFNIEPVDGTVSTRCDGDGSFSRLNQPKQVTLDCQIDAEGGTVSVTASKGSSGQTQSANFWGGLFNIGQEAGDDREAVLTLAGKRRCEKRGGRRTRVRRTGHARVPGGHDRVHRKKRRKGGRRLWGSGSGNYKTVGNHGAATVRGTIWMVADRCNGSTVFKVRRGTVVVRDFVRRAKVVLRAGQSYVAKADFDRLP